MGRTLPSVTQVFLHEQESFLRLRRALRRSDQKALDDLLQIGLIALAFVLIFIGDKYSIPLLFYTGMACFGMVSIAIGLEAILTRQIVVGSRRRRNRGTYTGLAAMFQGVQFSVFGLFLMAVAIMTYMRANTREAFLQFVRHPGLPLFVLGLLVLLQAVITMVGSLEQQEALAPGPDLQPAAGTPAARGGPYPGGLWLDGPGPV